MQKGIKDYKSQLKHKKYKGVERCLLDIGWTLNNLFAKVHVRLLLRRYCREGSIKDYWEIICGFWESRNIQNIKKVVKTKRDGSFFEV